jgi:hypothetical protein
MVAHAAPQTMESQFTAIPCSWRRGSSNFRLRDCIQRLAGTPSGKRCYIGAILAGRQVMRLVCIRVLSHARVWLAGILEFWVSRDRAEARTCGTT